MTQSRANRKVLVLPGDGIGPEIMREVMRVVEFFDRRHIASFEVSEGLVGGAAYDALKDSHRSWPAPHQRGRRAVMCVDQRASSPAPRQGILFHG